jgi:uncharacterized repeat protein (TIGR01451 family)
VADPAITKLGSPELALPGETVTFTIVVTNNGTAAATNLVVTDPLPDPLSPESATTTQGSFSISGSTVIFAVGTVNPGQVITLTVITRVRADVKPPLDVTNTAHLGAYNKSASATIRITSGALPATGESPDGGPTHSGLIGMLVALGIGGVVLAIAQRRRIISSGRKAAPPGR